MKTETKKKKKYPCPYCNYSSEWAGAITNHIKGNHLEGWKGSLSATLGIPDTPGARQRREERQRRQGLIRIGGRILKGRSRLSKRELIQKRKSNFEQRKRFLQMGLTSSGKKRKRGPADHIVAKYSLNNGSFSHKRAPFQVADETPAPVVTDWNGEAARAILVAAEIIKDVSVGMQLRSNQS